MATNKQEQIPVGSQAFGSPEDRDPTQSGNPVLQRIAADNPDAIQAMTQSQDSKLAYTPPESKLEEDQQPRGVAPEIPPMSPEQTERVMGAAKDAIGPRALKRVMKGKPKYRL